MPRGRRILSASETYHVMIRGNERKNIFKEEEDKLRFLDVLFEKQKTINFFLYAYCLMDNHVHLVIKENDEKLATIMKRINTSYVYYFNKKYKRVGHLLQDRFKSEAIENDNYFLCAIRYVHNNPVKAGMVESAREYGWSSYNLYLDNTLYRSDKLQKATVLDMFSNEKDRAIEIFRIFGRQPCKETFMDIDDEDDEDKDIEKIKKFIWSFLNEKEICFEQLKGSNYKNDRECLVKELRLTYKMSIRKIAKMLGLNQGIIQKQG